MPDIDCEFRSHARLAHMPFHSVVLLRFACIFGRCPTVDDLKANTEYAHYKASDPQIRWFWAALESFSMEEKAQFVQFVTGACVWRFVGS